MAATMGRGADIVDMTLEVVVVPVSDVDRAKLLSASSGLRLDNDDIVGADFRVVRAPGR
jgi:hypothetical protein